MCPLDRVAIDKNTFKPQINKELQVIIQNNFQKEYEIRK